MQGKRIKILVNIPVNLHHNASLDAEMDEHLESCNENVEANMRNGRLPKTLKTADGPVEIESKHSKIPRCDIVFHV